VSARETAGWTSAAARCCGCGGGGDRTLVAAPGRATSIGYGSLGWLGSALAGLTWSAARGAEPPPAPPRRPLVVQPIFTYPRPERQEMTSWRNWGGIQEESDVVAERARIADELAQLQTRADFPLQFRPLLTVRRPAELAPHEAAIREADALLFYAGGDGGGDLMANVNYIDALGKDVICFVRHKSGPLYYWYEGAMARLLHQHTDTLAARSIHYADVVVDQMDEVLWRLRALCGLHNTLGSRIIAIGGASGWADWNAPAGSASPELARRQWKLDIQAFSYDDLGRLIQEARRDPEAVERARQQAAEYLAWPGTTLQTDRTFVDNAFLLDDVFRHVLAQADCRALTVNGCMGTIMPLAETTACLTLSLLNDRGYLAFCESDFVVIPAGLLLANISGRPVFLNDPTYPHDGLITLAHCTAPRRMSGRQLDPARIMTHFESDYGAAPKVDMPVGQLLTNVVPDFRAEHWTGLLASIDAAPMLPICRSQIDIRFDCSDQTLARHMRGFHWITGYGDYLREVGYAARKVGLAWETLAQATT
jgi:hypothetical protein